MDIRFDGQVAVVTGAGAGLGRLYALELARRGAEVVVNDPGGSVDGRGADDSPALSVVKEIEGEGGVAVASLESVASAAGGAAIVQTALDAFGRIDVVVNNAGILRDRALHNMDPIEWQAVLDVHLNGAYWVTRAAFPHLREQRYGRIVFATSNAGLFGNFGQANYAAAKAGLVGLCRTTAIEGGRRGVLANVIAPIARTRMTETVLGDAVDLLTPEAVVPMATFLASSTCDVNGHVYSAAGGRYARVFSALAPGWVADGVPTAEDVARHLAEIQEPHGYIIPESVYDELDAVKAALAQSRLDDLSDRWA
jgi:NAD(P)-dependent dehydrogenase (short-subunit alcohol dehydrogenase family)